MKAFVAVLTAAVLVASAAWMSDTLAQAQQQPKAPAGTPAPAPGGAEKAKEIEGKVKGVDAAKKMVTLEDGTTLMVADAAQLKDLKPGTMIKASYEESGGQKIAKSLEVKKP